ncbi:MAG TPA: response regulator transcription factor [Chitinophagaceae bacterium]|nr:response regulator transcription factor [Chitinophagaceae bacterium]
MDLKKIKIILADDHVLLRNALASLINSFGEFEVIAQGENGEEVIDQLEKGNIPHLLVLDLNMPGIDGYETAKIIYEKYPQINVLVLTMYDSELALIRLLKVGVKGFLKKDTHPLELKKALLLVADSQYYYSTANINKLTGLIKNRHLKDSSQKNFLNDLEIQFLRLSSTDMTYKEIANTMNMTARKVDHFRDNLFEKLEVKSRVGLAMYAIKNGLISF